MQCVQIDGLSSHSLSVEISAAPGARFLRYTADQITRTVKLDQDQFIAYIRSRLHEASDARPVYRRFSDAISQLIQDGSMQAQDVLPGERLLAEQLGVSRVTVRRTIEYLVSMGVLSKRHGAKTIVMPRVEKALSQLIGFSEEIRARGMQPGARWLSCETSIPTPIEAVALDLPPGELVLRMSRLRLADGKPIALERAVVPASILPSGDLIQQSLYEALRNQGAFPVRGLQRIRAGIADNTDAKQLGNKPGTPMLIVERRCFLENGRAVEFTETRYNGEVYDFITELVPGTS